MDAKEPDEYKHGPVIDTMCCCRCDRSFKIRNMKEIDDKYYCIDCVYWFDNELKHKVGEYEIIKRITSTYELWKGDDKVMKGSFEELEEKLKELDLKL